MARKPRIHLSGGLYHVILRGNDDQSVFLSDEDRCRFFLLLQEGASRFDYRVHAFCLMTNHIHLALQVSDIPLSRAMQNLSFRYARWVNWRRRKTGHLFQGRYKAVLVDCDSYLLELVRYIHLNPVRANMVKDPEKYPWSSHQAYLGKASLPWLTTDWVLGQFGKSPATARGAYHAFVWDGLGEERRLEFHKGGEDSRLLGGNRFVERCLAGVECRPPRLAVEDVSAAVCPAYGIDEAELRAKSQQRVASEARAVIGWLGRELECVTLSEVARHVHRDIGSISSAVRRLSDRLRESPELWNRVQSLKETFAGPT